MSTLTAQSPTTTNSTAAMFALIEGGTENGKVKRKREAAMGEEGV